MRKHPETRAGSRSPIEELARQTGATFEEAKAAYERELERLDGQARVKTYVPVIARRRAREALSRHRH